MAPTERMAAAVAPGVPGVQVAGMAEDNGVPGGNGGSGGNASAGGYGGIGGERLWALRGRRRLMDPVLRGQ